jgi:hypothetical protein
MRDCSGVMAMSVLPFFLLRDGIAIATLFRARRDAAVRLAPDSLGATLYLFACLSKAATVRRNINGNLHKFVGPSLWSRSLHRQCEAELARLHPSGFRRYLSRATEIELTETG